MPIKVAQVITRLDPGGAQISTLNLCRALDPALFEVHLVAGPGGLLDEAARAKLRVHFVPELERDIRPTRDPVALLYLRRLFREQRFDLVHTHSSKAGILGRLAAKLVRVPVVVHTVHGFAFHPYQPPAARRAYILAERLAARFCDRWVMVCRSDMQKAIAARIARPEKMTLIRDLVRPGYSALRDWPLPDSETKPAWRPPAEDGEKPVVMVSCLKPQKNPLLFVETAQRILHRRPQTRFLIAGDGELRGAVEKELARRGIAHAVKIAGWVEDLAPVYRRSAVLVLTSLHEGLPIAVLEALKHGVPVVASRVDGLPEAVRDGENGFLCDPQDPESFCRNILKILDGAAGIKNGLNLLPAELETELSRAPDEMQRLYAGLLSERD